MAAATLAFLAPAAAHAATTITFNGTCATVATQTQAGCTALNGGFGNSATIAGTTGTNTLSNVLLKVSAWQYSQGTGAVTAAFLGDYSGGFGVTGAGDSSGGNNQHQIDNVGGYTDFVMLQFSQAVKLSSATLNLFQITGVSGMDSDLTVYDASVISPAIWNTSINPAIALNASNYNAARQSETAGTSTPGSRSVNTDGAFSNVWLIGASSIDTAHNDGFKLASIVVTQQTPGVPEPATWGMMILGFGAIGASLRRRRAANGALTA